MLIFREVGKAQVVVNSSNSNHRATRLRILRMMNRKKTHFRVKSSVNHKNRKKIRSNWSNVLVERHLICQIM
jgi:hypothetical protein